MAATQYANLGVKETVAGNIARAYIKKRIRTDESGSNEGAALHIKGRALDKQRCSTARMDVSRRIELKRGHIADVASGVGADESAQKSTHRNAVGLNSHD